MGYDQTVMYRSNSGNKSCGLWTTQCSCSVEAESVCHHNPQTSTDACALEPSPVDKSALCTAVRCASTTRSGTVCTAVTWRLQPVDKAGDMLGTTVTLAETWSTLINVLIPA